MRIKFQWPFTFSRSMGSFETPSDKLIDFFSGGITDSGINVNAATALTLSAVYNAVEIWGNSLNIPINVFKKLPNGDKEVQKEHPAQKVLHDRPHKEVSPAMWIQLMEYSRAFYGNGYSLILRDGVGDVQELRWVHPDFVEVKCDINTGYLFYDIKNDFGQVVYSNIASRDMIHVRTMSTDGYVGKPIIVIAAESLGVALQQQKFGATFFKNGSKNDAVLTYPGALEPKPKQDLKETINKNRKEGGVLLLEYGLDYKPISIPPEQAQFIESRKFAITDVARWFNIPPHMLKDLERATFSNIEHQSIEFVTHSVRPRARIYEQEFNYKLLPDETDVFTKFNLDALLRADMKTRYESYSIARRDKWMNANEIRELENKNRIPGDEGDVYENPNIAVKETPPAETPAG